jgi:TolB-like protein
MSAAPTTTRRLAAIVVADVVGYSRLLAADEAGTLAALRERRKAVVEPLVKRHAGRVVKFLGDGVLIEFPSAVNAVAFALDLQRRMDEMNEPVAESRRILLRVGINLGEVVGEGSDIYGDGVNIAARLEALAEPGGIVVSAKVHEEVRGKTAATLEELGERRLHNIAQPVRVYAVRPSSGAAARQPAGTLPEKPTVAVLPFDNMSGDPEQEYFSNGITEDIISQLSRFRSLFVIARNSSFAFKGRAIDLREVGRRLGASYIVEGSVRKSGQRVRITAQLIDAASGNHLWSERYDRDLADIFTIQDEVTAAIAGTVAGQVQIAGIESVRRRTGNLAAYDWYLKGLEHWDRAGAEDTAPAMSCFAKAIELDPNFARAHALLACAQVAHAISRWSEHEHDSGLDKALRSAERAVALDGNDAIGYAALSEVYFCKKRLDLAAFHIGKARALNPNDPYVIVGQCFVEAFGANPERTLELVEHARRLSPVQPNWFCEPWGVALYQLRRYAEAADVFERATAKRPYITRYLAACHAQLGELTKAKAAAAESLRHEPNFSLTRWLASEPYASEANLLHMAEGMRKAGLPE